MNRLTPLASLYNGVKEAKNNNKYTHTYIYKNKTNITFYS